MFRMIGLCLCLAVCAGCREKKGFEPSDVHFCQMAADAAYRIKASHLPAKTSFALSGSDNAVFDAAFSEKLREMGFSVNEAGEGAKGVPLKPAVFFVGEREAVVVVQVGEGQLQRGFDLVDGDISPNSYWMARRDGDGR